MNDFACKIPMVIVTITVVYKSHKLKVIFFIFPKLLMLHISITVSGLRFVLLLILHIILRYHLYTNLDSN